MRLDGKAFFDSIAGEVDREMPEEAKEELGRSIAKTIRRGMSANPTTNSEEQQVQGSEICMPCVDPRGGIASNTSP